MPQNALFFVMGLAVGSLSAVTGIGIAYFVWDNILEQRARRYWEHTMRHAKREEIIKHCDEILDKPWRYRQDDIMQARRLREMYIKADIASGDMWRIDRHAKRLGGEVL